MGCGAFRVGGSDGFTTEGPAGGGGAGGRGGDEPSPQKKDSLFSMPGNDRSCGGNYEREGSGLGDTLTRGPPGVPNLDRSKENQKRETPVKAWNVTTVFVAGLK